MTLVQKQDFVRYLFWAFWFVALPIGFAVSVVMWCASGNALGSVGQFIGGQQIPSGIVLFTLAEMTLYYFRHELPFSDLLAGKGPEGLPREMRREYEAAGHLLDETQRLMERHRKAIEQNVASDKRRQLESSLEQLKQAVDAEQFDAQRLREHYQRTNVLVDEHLAPWRKSEAREYIESIAIAVLIAFALRAVVVEAFKIPSGSMLPTLQVGDHIFVNKFTYGPMIPLTDVRVASDMPPERGDVIVFEFPDPDPAHEGDDFIKRVIALPGDTLEVKRGHPIINGWEVPSCKAGPYPYGENDGHSTPYGDLFVEFLGDSAYLTVYETPHPTSGLEGPFEVGPNEVYVMGDNRHNSHDSRRWRNGAGAGVPFENIRGRAMSVWLPLSRFMVPVMGHELPERVPDELRQGVRRCLEQRPAQTLPPAPSRR